MNKTSIYSLTFEAMEQFFEAHQKKAFIVKQIFDWLYKKMVFSFDEMTNLSKENINFLKSHFYFDTLKISKLLVDQKDGTVKILFELEDQNKIETVLMKFNYGYSVCITTQVGCNMGCHFCASGKLKRIRNLKVSEMVLQILLMQKYLKELNGQRISRIVVMGIGEPFDNFDNLLKFLDLAKDRKALEIGARHITVSTCGIIPKIIEWANLKSQVNLAISLHAPTNEIRNQIMPINKAYNLEKLLEAIDYYLLKNKRRITIEYILIKGINDRDEDAYKLAEILSNKLVYVNIIPYNNISDNFYQRSKREHQFFNILNSKNITCTIRQEKGSLINAACGQLRAKAEGKL
ncbi:MAG: 23S rRNA (adenine(2503)-C(2))-methyltransferase RlmN [Mycoplasmoidaceae bacterium]